MPVVDSDVLGRPHRSALSLAVVRASHILCPHKQSNSLRKPQHQAFVASPPPSRPVRDFLRRFGTSYTPQLRRRLSRRFGSRLASTPRQLRHSTSGTMVLFFTAIHFPRRRVLSYCLSSDGRRLQRICGIGSIALPTSQRMILTTL